MSFISKTLLFPFTLLGLIIGRINWTMPPWLVHLNELRKRSLGKFIALLLIIFAVFYGVWLAFDYYQNRPTLVLVTTNIIVPEPLSEGQIAEQAPPNPLQIEFVYNQISPLVTNASQRSALPEDLRYPEPPADYPSVAPLNDIGYEVLEGIRLRPQKEGQWLWQDDRTLVFTPITDWPPGQEYTVSFAQSVFDTAEEFSDDEFSFTTSELQIELDKLEFEMVVSEDIRAVYADFLFSHPVNKQSFTDALNARFQTMQDSTQAQGTNNQGASNQDTSNQGSNTQNPETENNNLSFTTLIDFDEQGMAAYVTIQLDALPQQSKVLELVLNAGVTSIFGGEPSTEDIEQKVVVPDRFSYLKVASAETTILRDEENNPEQFVLLSFTDDMALEQIQRHFDLYLLPNEWQVNSLSQGAPEASAKYWESPREITQAVLNASEKVAFDLLPNPNASSKNYQLRIDVAPSRQLYLRMRAGFESINGFTHRSLFDKIVQAPTYPKEIAIFGEGSVLTHNPKQRLSFLSRGVPAVNVSIGKVMQDQLYHLITQTNGDISNPNFANWQFGAANLSTFDSEILPMAKQQSLDPKTAAYGNVNLNKYFAKDKNSAQQELGLFFVELKAWDPAKTREIYGVSDKRLILMTNLGLIVKTNAQGEQSVFVQSLVNGKPVAGAKVELLGKNGVPLMNGMSNNMGLVTLPSAQGLTKEKQPTVYVVTHKGDVSFLPYNRYTRQINYSRFNVSGVRAHSSQQNDEQNIKAFLFTDRGIYRPGESINLAAIVKDKKFGGLEGIPLELEIRDPQYKIVETAKITLPQFGVFDYQFASSQQASTGYYEVTLYMKRNAKNGRSYRYHLGNVGFQVEEFQPDTVSISSQFDRVETKGWTTATKLKATVNMQNLFGVPAQEREVTIALELTPTEFSFTEFEGYEFNRTLKETDASDGMQRKDIQFPAQQTNADGETVFDIDFTGFNKGAYRVNFSAQGFEQSGGRSVNTRSAFLYSALPHLVGVKASGKLDYINMGSTRSAEFIAISNRLDTIALQDLTLQKSRVQSISTLVKQSNGRFEYESIRQQNLISSEALSISADGYQHVIDTSEAGDFVLEILDADNQLLSLLEYKVVGEGNTAGKLDQNADLQIALNKSSYQAGESIELSIQAPYTGSGLISIESDKVHSFKWFTASNKNTIESIDIPAGIEGNAYINVTFLRDLNSPDIYMSPLSYAVEPFYIDRAKRILDVDISVAKIVQPGESMKIDVAVSQASKIVVYAVDTGILQVANYQLPKPLDFFLQKRALSVRTMQMLDLILPDYVLSLSLVPGMLSAAGGDMEAKRMMADMITVTGSRMRQQDPFARAVEAPVVYWSGVIDAEQGNNTVYFDVPDTFAGGLKVMAVAANEQAMGRDASTSIVRGPFVLTPNLPTHVAPNDTFAVTLGIANVLENSGKEALLNVSLNNSEHLLQISAPSAKMSTETSTEPSTETSPEPSAQLDAETNSQTAQSSNDTQVLASRTIAIDEGNEDKLTYWFKAQDVLGGAFLNFEVSYTDSKGKVFSVRQQASIKVRPANPYSVKVDTGETSQKTLNISVDNNLHAQEATQIFTASASPLVIVEGLSSYLDEFPHGCTEQMVSQVFPLVGLSNSPRYKNQGTEVQAQFEALIGSLRQRQNYDGGFNYWPTASNKSDPYISIYVLHFLLEAQSVDFVVPKDMLSAGVRYLESLYFESEGLNNSAPSLESMRNRAQAIYLLSRSGMVTSNMIIDWTNTMQTHNAKTNNAKTNNAKTNNAKANNAKTWQSDIGAAYIAASYALLQQYDQAKELFKGYQWQTQSNVPANQFSAFYTPLALNAQYVFLIAKHMPELIKTQINGGNGQNTNQPISQITAPIYEGEYNTHSAAYSMLALGAYHQALDKSGSASLQEIDNSLSLQARVLNTMQQAGQAEPAGNGGDLIELPFASDKQGQGGFPIAKYPINSTELVLSANQNTNGLTNSVSNTLYYVNVQAGYEKTMSSAAIKQGIEVERVFLNGAGEVVESAVQGDELTVQLRMRATDLKFIDHVAVVDLLPGGFSVIRSSIARSSREQSNSRSPRHGNINANADHIEIKEDRIIYYGRVTNRMSEFTYKVKVTAAGDFAVPPTLAESMYNRSIIGRSVASAISVSQD